MSKFNNEEWVVMVGAAAALLYVLKVTGKPGAEKKFTIWNPFKSNPGFGYDPSDPGDFILSKDLINGTIADEVRGQQAGYATPTTEDIFKSVTENMNDTGDPNKSMIRVGYW